RGTSRAAASSPWHAWEFSARCAATLDLGSAAILGHCGARGSPASGPRPSSQTWAREVAMQFTPEHEGIRRNVKKFIDAEINPHVDEWEEAGMFPAHELFKKMG